MQTFLNEFLKRIKGWAFILFFCCLGLKIAAQQNISATGEWAKFTIPERNRDGSLKWQFTGARAKNRPDGKVEVESVFANTYEKGQVDWTLTTPHCILDSKKVNEKTKGTDREIVSDSDVHIFNKKFDITGTGFHWLVDQTRFIIRKQVQVTISGGFSKNQIL